MLASPSPLDRFAEQRILCLLLQPQSSRAEQQSRAALCEAFLRFSPRVQMRAPYSLFIDIGSTAAVFGGEELIIRQASELAQTFGFSVKAAISDTPSGAHVFAHSLTLACSSESHLICPHGAEKETLQHLSLPLLLHLHGVESVAQPIVLQQMTAFCYTLGFRTFGDISAYGEDPLRQKWGAAGVLIWRRLQGFDFESSNESIAPFVALQPLQESVYLDYPASLVSLLLHEVRKANELLFARLRGRRLAAQSLTLRLGCEYSDSRFNITVEPQNASGDKDLFFSLLEEKLEGLDLENPVRDFDLEVVACAENNRQLEFIETAANSRRLQTLLSVLKLELNEQPTAHQSLVPLESRNEITALIEQSLNIKPPTERRFLERIDSEWWDDNPKFRLDSLHG